MRNLQLLELVDSPLVPEITDTDLTSKVFDQTPTCIYYIKNCYLNKFDLATRTTSEVTPQLFENVLKIKYLAIENKVCVVTSECLYIVEPNGVNEVRCLTLLDDNSSRIAGVSWNPTEEVVVVVTDSASVNTYNIDYEGGDFYPTGTSTLDAKIPDTVYVGWGSKDTQFRGSEGKAKPQQTPVETEPVVDRTPHISWRGNGEMFAINHWTNDSRALLVFESPCKPTYRSEPCPGLQPPVAWRPAGNMIATVTMVATRQRVVVFEKNGQRRFEFELSLDEGDRVVDLKWSPCAQVLTVESTSSDSRCQTLHLLTSSNYHWFKKQGLRFDKLLHWDWLEGVPLGLLTVTESQVVKYHFGLTHSCAVINGSGCQISDFGESVTPPPVLCTRYIDNGRQINFVHFVTADNILTVDSDNLLKVYDKMGDPVFEFDLKQIDNATYPLAYHHFVNGSSIVYFIVNSKLGFVNPVDGTSGICCDVSGDTRHLSVLPSVTDSPTLVPLHTHEGSTIYTTSTDLVTVKEALQLVDDHLLHFQLTQLCHFYVNSRQIAELVNSFQITPLYLVFTTKLNRLYCIRLKHLVNAAPPLSNFYSRSIEQGATIVAINSPKITLQMPRGNLETITCRLISVDMLDTLLNRDQWDEAIRFVRLEKLNANLLFDLDPDRFLSGIDRLISAVKTVQELNNLLLEFEEGTCVYRDKIKVVFRAILEYFDTRVDYATYVTTIMVIHYNFFTVREAMVYLQDLIRRPGYSRELGEAVKILQVYGCDQQELYRVSLSLYDLELAHFVASSGSSMDPRVYEPQLNALRLVSEVERRFEINQVLKQPKIAVKYLLRLSKSDDEVEAYVKSHHVSLDAYKSCPIKSRYFALVSRALAGELSCKNRHSEAGAVLIRAGLKEEALEEFRLGLHWREVLNLLPEEEVQRVEIVSDLARKMAQRGLVKDAAFLYEFHARNYEQAVKILIDNCLFGEALHIARKFKRNDIVVSELVPGLVKHFRYLTEKLTELHDLFKRHKERLCQVRLNLNNPTTLDLYEERGDLFSDAGSVVSRSSRSSRSRSSTASSKNRRKEQRKKQDLREGGVYEDIALVRALHGTISEIYLRAEEVGSCCLLMLQESDWSYCRIKWLWNLFKEVDQNVRSSLVDIWPPHFHLNNPSVDVQNLEHLDLQYRSPPSLPDENRLNDLLVFS